VDEGVQGLRRVFGNSGRVDENEDQSTFDRRGWYVANSHSPTMKEMERNILDGVLVEVEISSKKSPEVEDVPPFDLEVRRVIRIVLAGSVVRVQGGRWREFGGEGFCEARGSGRYQFQSSRNSGEDEKTHDRRPASVSKRIPNSTTEPPTRSEYPDRTSSPNQRCCE